MGKFENILIVTDLDGTLLRNDKTISRENLSAIEYFKKNGGTFTFITGRSIVVVGQVYDIIRPNAPIGCFNGGAVYDMEKKAFLFQKTLPSEGLDLVRLVDREMPGMSIQLCGFNNCYFCKMNDAMERVMKLFKFPELRCHYDDVKEKIAKVIFVHSKETELIKLREMLEKHPLAGNLQLVRSGAEYLEMLPKGLGKGESLVRIAEIMGIDIKRTIGIGDNENDVSLIEKAGIGVAVENASDCAKEVADIITVSNEENAIAKIIKDLDEGIIKV
ncbi:MAG: HAD family phosphatase [Clostridia bacterium]|nr:HAD family phosphatase [Clostridia bacterium]